MKSRNENNTHEIYNENNRNEIHKLKWNELDRWKKTMNLTTIDNMDGIGSYGWTSLPGYYWWHACY
jgi:hypothetical protein